MDSMPGWTGWLTEFLTTFGHFGAQSGLSARVPENKKTENGRLASLASMQSLN